MPKCYLNTRVPSHTPVEEASPWPLKSSLDGMQSRDKGAQIQDSLPLALPGMTWMVPLDLTLLLRVQYGKCPGSAFVDRKCNVVWALLQCHHWAWTHPTMDKFFCERRDS